MIMNKAANCFLLINIFFVSTMGMEAQEADYYFNPNKKPEGITIQLEADFSKYDYEYEILNVYYASIKPRGQLQPTDVRERFISTIEELDMIDKPKMKDKVEINWTGREADGFKVVPDGPYTIEVYEINKIDKSDLKKHFYTVIIDTKNVIFSINLDSNTIYKRLKDVLACNVSPSSAVAYIWNVRIQNNDEIIKEQTFKLGYDIQYPGFFWNEYKSDGPEEQQLFIIVEAIDRAGNQSIQTASFRLTNSEETVKIDEDNKLLKNGIIKEQNSDGEFLQKRGYDFIVYDVKRGDYLAKIAREYYGSAPLWGLIYEINKSRFPDYWNPNLILPEMQLVLPTKEYISEFLETGRQISEEN